jgi:hypothetical protein
VALGVIVLTHEAVHLSGIADDRLPDRYRSPGGRRLTAG